MQDQLFNFGDLTKEIDHDVFEINPLPGASYEKNDGTQFDITFERDLDLKLVKRSGYTILDLISNVGGLRTLMSFGFTVLMSYWNFNSSANHMVSRLFLYKSAQGMSEQAKSEE